MNQWTKFNSISELSNKHEVKLTDGKVKAVGAVRNYVEDKDGNIINSSDILYFRAKKDYKRYNKLVKDYEFLQGIDEDFLDNIESILFEYNSDVNIKTIIEDLRELILNTEVIIMKESKEFLKN